MKNIGKNHSCPCMSGKKYKDCCINREYLADFEEQGLKYYDEKYMLQSVMKDESFKKFYESMRYNIKHEISWLSLKNGLNSSMAYSFYNKEIALIVNNEPSRISLEKSIEVAHEIQHILCCEKGFKIVYNKSNYAELDRIAGLIADIVNDPIVNSNIKDYGFDLLTYYKKADESQKCNLNIRTLDGQIFLISSYVKKTLDMRNIYSNISDEEIEYNQWIRERYPEIIPISKQILKIVEQIGFNTPQKSEIALQEIINLLRLSDKLTVIKL